MSRAKGKFHLLVIGNGVPAIRGRLEREEFCTTLSEKENIEKYIRLFDIYVSSSLTETTSLSTVEAMTTGIPVICTPAGYIPDYVEHGKNGYIFPFKDSYTLSKLLEKLKDSETRKRIGENARKKAKEVFSWSKTAKRIEQVLTQTTQDYK